MSQHLHPGEASQQVSVTRTWWAWRDLILEEWFYTDIDPSSSPNLVAQLHREGATIHQVQAETGRQALEILVGPRTPRSPRPPRIH